MLQENYQFTIPFLIDQLYCIHICEKVFRNVSLRRRFPCDLISDTSSWPSQHQSQIKTACGKRAEVYNTVDNTFGQIFCLTISGIV